MKRRLVRLAIVVFGGVVLLCGVLAVIIWRRPGTVQDWIGVQIETIANGYLNPKLSFTDLRYVYPLEVSLKNLRLTADDPEHPGHTIDIIACNQAEVSLAEIPSIGKPIVIERISLDQPLISAVAVEPRSKKFVGFADLLRGGSSNSQTTSSSSPPKLSDVFRMKLVEIKNGKIFYDPRIPGTVPMTLDQINTLLNIDRKDAGWYAIDTDIARKPVLDLHVKGQLNLDTFNVKDADINLLADLGRDKLDYLPPEIQALLKQYDAKGKLHIEVMGSMPVLDPLKGEAELTVNLDGANLALSGLRIPVEHLALKTNYSDGKVTLPSLTIDALDGSADVSGSIALNDRLDADLRVAIAGMVPQELLADPAMRADSPAKLNLNLSVATPLQGLLGKVPGIAGQPLASVALSDLRLWAADPVNAGQDLDLIACKKLDVELNEPIVSGRPIVVDKLALDHPVISAVSVAPGAMQFVGIPNIPPKNASQANGAPSNPPASAMGKLSDLVRVKSLQLTGAKIIYDPRIPGTQRMCLDRIDTTINIDPNNPGAYQLNAELSRQPVFDLGINGEIDLDNPGLQDVNLHLSADLTQNQLDFLPPQLQLILQRTGAKAKLNFDGTGSVAMSDLSHATCKIETDIQNIEFAQGNLHIPVKDFALSARLENRTIWQKIRIAALNNVFDLSGTVALNNRLDTDLTLTLTDLQLESLVAALRPDAPVLDSSTKLNAEIEIKSPLMVALGAEPRQESEPIADLDIRKLRLTTENPLESGATMDFVACDEVAAALSSLPVGGNPAVIDYVQIRHPVIRALATTRGSNEFAGFLDLQKMASAGTATAAPPSNASAPSPTAGPQMRIGNLVQLHSLAVTDATIYYDPQIDNTIPLSFDAVTVNAKMDSMAGDAYRFDALLPAKPDFSLEVGGRVNVDSLVVDPVTLKLTTILGGENPKYFPPQVQKLLVPYDLSGKLGVSATGSLPLRDPISGRFDANLTLDDFQGTFSGWRIPVQHLRLPTRIKWPQLDIFDSSPLGGPTVEALGGTINLTGTEIFNDKLDSTLSIHVDHVLMEDLMACKLTGTKPKLIGPLQADVELYHAPLLAVAAAATPPPQPEPAPAGTPADSQTPQAMSVPPPVNPNDLPPYWGWAEISTDHASLAGISLMKGVTDFAKTAFSDLFTKKQPVNTNEIVAKESAYIVCLFHRDHLDLKQIHYEAEDFAADGSGYITLDQQMDLHLTGGLFQKLGGLGGGIGSEIKQISDSLLTYHIYGSFHNIQYDVKRGDGKPIVLAAKQVTKQGEKYIGIGLNQAGKGLNKAGQFIGGLFNHKKNQDQSQTQPSQ